jgi:hypothetical protein
MVEANKRDEADELLAVSQILLAISTTSNEELEKLGVSELDMLYSIIKIFSSLNNSNKKEIKNYASYLLLNINIE